MEEKDLEAKCPVASTPIKIDIWKHCTNDYCDAITLDNDCRALRVIIRRVKKVSNARRGSSLNFYSSEDDLEEDVKTKKDLTMYKCRVCGLGNLHSSELLNHRAMHIDNPFTCKACGKGYVSENAAKLHVVCLHLTDHHTSQNEFSKDMERALCNKGLDINTYIVQNRDGANVEGYGMFVEDGTLKSILRCNIVEQSIENEEEQQRALRRRIRLNRRASCSVMMVLFLPNQSYNTFGKYIVTSYINLHKIVASVKSGFLCPVCGTKCKSRKHMYNHIRKEHMKWRCNVCGVGFGERNVYMSHMATHKYAKFYQCCICNARYYSNKSLNAHLHQHTMQRLDNILKPPKLRVEEVVKNGSVDDSEEISVLPCETKEEPILFHLSDSDDSIFDVNG